jgi:CheY-like chemotaxis protein
MSNKLLLADDSITIRKVVGIIFANEDYELSVVDNGGEALAKAREISPDIILADVMMPDKTGYEVCTEIRNDPALSNIPLLLLAGAFEPFDEDKARQCGADDFITKPFESQQLLEKVRQLIELGKERKTAKPVQEPEPVTPEPLQPSFIIPPPTASIAEEMEVTPLQLGAVDEESAFLIEDLSEEEEIIEALPEDDLWGAFELEEVADVEGDEFETLLEEEAVEPFGKFEAAEEYVLMKEEPPGQPVIAPEITAAPPEEAGTVWKPTDEGTFTLGEETQHGEFEIVSGEEPVALPVEEVETTTEPDMGGIFELGAEAEDTKPDLSYLREPRRVLEPVIPEPELQFAPEEEYVPVIPPVEPPVMGGVFQPGAEEAVEKPALSGLAATTPGVYSEPTLSEEQLASMVA